MRRSGVPIQGMCTSRGRPSSYSNLLSAVTTLWSFTRSRFSLAALMNRCELRMADSTCDSFSLETLLLMRTARITRTTMLKIVMALILGSRAVIAFFMGQTVPRL